jgi:hypothetical protein
MPRILYALLSSGNIRGGHKMTVRHVEALRALGFNAFIYVLSEEARPTWLDHSAPFLFRQPILPDDIMVLPEDSAGGILQMANRLEKTVIFYQGAHARAQLEAIDSFPPARFPAIVTVGRRHAADISRLYPAAQVEFVPCFVDHQLFKPGTEKSEAVVYSASKRPNAASAISRLLNRLHPGHSSIHWRELSGIREPEVADILSSSTLLLSLGHFESVGLMPLEAMASDCVCVGFTGVGGWEYATAENGFWVPDDDYIAAADALAEAADLIKTGGPALRAMKEAGRETAAQWSYSVFLEALERVWSDLAPQAQIHRPR